MGNRSSSHTVPYETTTNRTPYSYMVKSKSEVNSSEYARRISSASKQSRKSTHRSRDLNQIVECLREVQYFAHLNQHALTDLAHVFNIVELNKGQVLFEEGDLDRNFYIVLQGSIDVLTQRENGEADVFSSTTLSHEPRVTVSHKPSFTTAMGSIPNASMRSGILGASVSTTPKLRLRRATEGASQQTCMVQSGRDRKNKFDQSTLAISTRTVDITDYSMQRTNNNDIDETWSDCPSPPQVIEEDPSERTRILATESRGAHFGEASLVFGGKRPVTVRGHQDGTWLLQLTHDAYSTFPRPHHFDVLRSLMKQASITALTDKLREVPYFSALPPARMQLLANLFRLELLEPGAVVCHEGEPGDCMYVILDGRVQVVSRGRRRTSSSSSATQWPKQRNAPASARLENNRCPNQKQQDHENSGCTSNRHTRRSRIICKGFLEKRGGHIRTWKSRYCVLRGDILTYYDVEQRVNIPVRTVPRVVNTSFLSQSQRSLDAGSVSDGGTQRHPLEVRSRRNSRQASRGSLPLSRSEEAGFVQESPLRTLPKRLSNSRRSLSEKTLDSRNLAADTSNTPSSPGKGVSRLLSVRVMSTSIGRERSAEEEEASMPPTMILKENEQGDADSKDHTNDGGSVITLSREQRRLQALNLIGREIPSGKRVHKGQIRVVGIGLWKRHPHGFVIRTEGGRLVYAKASSVEDRLEWVRSVRSAIQIARVTNNTSYTTEHRSAIGTDSIPSLSARGWTFGATTEAVGEAESTHQRFSMSGTSTTDLIRDLTDTRPEDNQLNKPPNLTEQSSEEKHRMRQASVIMYTDREAQASKKREWNWWRFGRVPVLGKLVPDTISREKAQRGKVLSDGESEEDEDVTFLVSELGSGSYFGEISLLTDLPRSATVVAKYRTTLAKLPKQHFQNLLRLMPDVKDEIDVVVKQRSAANLRTLNVPFLAGFTEQKLNNLAQMAGLVRLSPNEVVFREGDIGKSFYIILQGSVGVFVAFKSTQSVRQTSMDMDATSEVADDSVDQEAMEKDSVCDTHLPLRRLSTLPTQITDDDSVMESPRTIASDQASNTDAHSSYGRLVNVLHPGSYFGEIALITRGKRRATIIAREHTTLLELRREHFVSLFGGGSSAEGGHEDEIDDKPEATSSTTRTRRLSAVTSSALHRGSMTSRSGYPSSARSSYGHGNGGLSSVLEDTNLDCTMDEGQAFADFELRLFQHRCQLLHVLRHPIGMRYFRQALEKEYSAENLDFWSSVQSFRATFLPHLDGLSNHAQSILFDELDAEVARIRAEAMLSQFSVVESGTHVSRADEVDPVGTFWKRLSATHIDQISLTTSSQPRKHMEAELSLENCSSLLNLVRRCAVQAMAVYEMFITDNASTQINIHSRVRYEVDSAVNQMTAFVEACERVDEDMVTHGFLRFWQLVAQRSGASGLAQAYLNMSRTLLLWAAVFDEAHLEIYELMKRDNFARFKRSELFTKLLKDVNPYEDLAAVGDLQPI